MLYRKLFGITLGLSAMFAASGSVNLAEACGLRHRCCVPVYQPVPCPVVIVQPRVMPISVVRTAPVTRVLPSTTFARPVGSPVHNTAPMIRQPVAPVAGFGQQGFGQQGFGYGGPQVVLRTYKITKIRYKVPKKPIACPPVNCCPQPCPPVQIICPPVCPPVICCPPVECNPCEVRSPRYCVPRKKFCSTRRSC